MGCRSADPSASSLKRAREAVESQPLALRLDVLAGPSLDQAAFQSDVGMSEVRAWPLVLRAGHAGGFGALVGQVQVHVQSWPGHGTYSGWGPEASPVLGAPGCASWSRARAKLYWLLCHIVTWAADWLGWASAGAGPGSVQACLLIMAVLQSKMSADKAAR